MPSMPLPAVLLTLALAAPAAAEYNPDKLGEAAGGYMFATLVMEQFQVSVCSYLTRTRDYSVDAYAAQVLPHLDARDRAELTAMITGRQLAAKRAAARRYVEGFLAAGRKGGQDDRTLCGMLASNLALVYLKGESDWAFARENYTR